MPYVNRNEQGSIVQLLDAPLGENSEWLELSHAAVVYFLQNGGAPEALKANLENSDNDMARVVEDLIDLLMDKQVLVFTELPEAVQGKLNARRKLRDNASEVSNLIGDDDFILVTFLRLDNHSVSES